MSSRRGACGFPARKFCLPLLALLAVLIVVAPLFFLGARIGSIKPSSGQGQNILDDDSATTQTQNALNDIEKLFPKEMVDMIVSKVDDSGPLSLNVAGRKDLSSSWVIEGSGDVSRVDSSSFKTYFLNESMEDMPIQNIEGLQITGYDDDTSIANDETLNVEAKEESSSIHQQDVGEISDGTVSTFKHSQMDVNSPAKIASRRARMQRREKRLAELMRHKTAADLKLEEEAIQRTKELDVAVLGKYSIWRRDIDENSDSLVRLIRDQLIMARVYTSIAQSDNNTNLLRDLRFCIKECQRALGETNSDVDLPRSIPEKIKSMGQVLSIAREQYYNCTAITKKLWVFLQSTEEQARMLKKQITFLSQLAAKTIPRGIHCLSLRLTIEYSMLPEDKRDFPNKEKLGNSRLYHYALFSDNVLAASVVVNSTVLNAKEPEKHVFHLVTDKLNYGAMKMWFRENPPGNASIEVQNVDDFKWLNASYCPVLRQLESATMKEYYFKAGHPTSLADGSSNLKYRNPKYLSMLNHLRFYLPEVFPKLDKILFLDDDIVVQKDLTPLWSVNLHGKVNGAVETCGQSFHRFDKYLNFSNPLISRNFNPRACGWAYGMNVFDLQEWKRKDITGIYHKWQNKNEDRLLWKLGTLPPGLITFYNLTYPLDKSWHVLGLGYNPSVGRNEIDGAAVIHYNGNMKPWLELAMAKYKPYWMKYEKSDHLFLQQCDVNR